MVSEEALRRSLEAADVRRMPYAVAEACAGLLERNPGDAYAANQYVRALAVLGLGTAAWRVLAGRGNERAREMAAMLERVPAGVIPWSSRRRRFQANLRALEARGMPAAAIVAAWEDPAARNAERYELHQALDGNFFMADRQAEGAEAAPWKAWLGVGGLRDLQGAAGAVTREQFAGEIGGPVVFDGMGCGWLVCRMLEVSQRYYLTYSPPMYVVEPDLAALAMALHLHDWQAWIAEGRLRLYMGEAAADRFEQSLRERREWTLPVSVLSQPLRERAPLGLGTRVEAVSAAREEAKRQTAERVAAYYAGFSAADWRKRFAEAAAGGPPLRVLGITTRYSTVLRYSMEELQAVAEAGVGTNLRMEICMEPDDQSLEKDYVGMIDRLKPDLLVSISRMRHENPDVPRNVPALCWDQDNLPCMRDPAVLADLKGLTFVAGHGAVLGATELNWPLEACIFCYPAGMTHRYVPGEPTAEEAARFGSDVSYVSHASGMPEKLRADFRPKWQAGPREYRKLFDACAEQVIGAAGGKPMANRWDWGPLIRAAAEQAKAPLIPAVEQALTVDLRLLADRVFRHEALGWAAQWCEARGKRLRLWGNGWEEHPTLAKWAAGAAVPGGQVQAVYRATRINLQIIGTGLVHSRLLDGWAAGGFFLLRRDHGTDDAGRTRMANRYRAAQLAAEERIATLGELEARGSAELRGLWAPMAGEYATRRRDAEFPEFRIWRDLAPAHVLFPDLERVLFDSAEDFARLADEYSENPARRREVAGRIRKSLLDGLSYDARWRDFVGHISAHLGYAGAPADAGKG